MKTETLDLSDCTESSLRAGDCDWVAMDSERAQIQRGEVAVWRNVPAGSVLRVSSGVVWLTQEGRAGDHVLGTGQCFRFRNSNAVVGESLLGDAVVELRES